MARISTYINDTTINDEDLLTGSNFIRIGEYNTRNYKLVDLAEYFANFQISDNQLYNFATISQQVTTNVSDIAANATYSLNLGASFGVVDDDGNLTSLSEAFANNLLSVATSEDYATATQLNSLTIPTNWPNSRAIRSRTLGSIPNSSAPIKASPLNLSKIRRYLG